MEKRLQTRVNKGISLLNSRNGVMLSKGVEVTLKVRLFLDYVSSQAPSFTIVDSENN